MAIACLALFYCYLPEDRQSTANSDWALARTMVFVTLAQFQLFYVLALRSTVDPFWKLGLWSNYRLTGAVLLGTMLQLAVVYVPPLAKVFHTQPLSAGQLALSLAVASSAFLLAEGAKWLSRRRK